MLMFCAFCGMLASVHAEDITEDVIKTAEGNINAIEFVSSGTLGTVNATVKATATDGHNAYGIYAPADLFIQKLGKEGSVAAEVSGNYGGAIYSKTGNITIVDPIEGKITAVGTGSASKQVYGIFAEGVNVDVPLTVTLGGIAETGSIEVSAKKGYVSAVAAKGRIVINGDIAGKVTSSSGTASGSRQAYTFWSKNGGISLNSLTATALVSADSLNMARAFYSQGDFELKGELAGTITSVTTGYGDSYAIIGNTLSTVNANVTIGSVASTARISSIARGDYSTDAYGIYATGQVTVTGNMDGVIAVQAQNKAVYGIKAERDVTLGGMGAGSSITAVTTGTDAAAAGACGIWAGNEPGGSLFLIDLTMGDIQGTVSASSAAGQAIGMYARVDVSLGEVSKDALISADSSAGGAVYGIWGNGGVSIDRIDGKVSASTTGHSAYAIVGLGLEMTVGETGSITATGADGSSFLYALYSGCYQGGKFITYNVEDSLTIHAGATIKGAIELGGSGKVGEKDVLNLLGGTAAKSGIFDNVVTTTINTKNQTDGVSYVQLNIGTDDTPAYWEVKGQSDLFNQIRINPGSVVTVNDASLTPRSGGSLLNMGMIEGTGTLVIGSEMTFITGVLGMNGTGTGLETQSTGLGSGISVTIEKGASLGTSVVNTTQDAWVITEDQIDAARNELFSGLVGSGYSSEDYTFTYFLKGQVYLGSGTPVEFKPGTALVVGEGAVVTLGENLPTNGFELAGGTVDVSSSVPRIVSSANKISGSAGTLVMGTDQELVLDQSQTIGYSVRSKDASIGKLTVTGSGNVIHASGNYNARTVNIVNGAILSLEGGTLGSGEEGASIQVGAEYISEKNPASLILRDAVVKSELNIGAGSLLQGTGTLEKQVTLYGSNVRAGNSPGVMNFAGGLDLRGVSDLTFYVGGVAPGTYSSMNVGTSLSWQFSHVNVELGDKLLASDSDTFSLVLIDASKAETVTGLDEGQSLEITKNKEFLSGSDLVWDEATRQLVFTGTLNRGLVDDLKKTEGVALANSLWTSTRSVNNFARVARAQLNSPRAGKANIWFAGLGDFTSMDSEGSVEGFDYKGGGYAVGADYVLEKNWTGGVAFGQSFGTNEADMSIMKIKQDSVMASLYARYFNELNNRLSVSLDSYVAFGSVQNKANGTTVNGEGSHAKWDDSVATFGTRFNWNCKVGEKSLLIPFVGMDFTNGQQEEFKQAYGAGENRYFDGKMQTWTIPVGLTWKTDLSLGGAQVLTPEITVAYAGDIDRRDPRVRTMSLGERLDIDGSSPGRNAFIGGAGLRWTINAQWNVGASYDIECRSGMTNQGVNANVHYTF